MGFAFILMPFRDKESEDIKERVIKKVCEELGLELKRADDYFTSTAIIDDVISAIKDADIIIADITGKNPNVFYELGYAHALKQKRTILITRENPENMPFDIKHLRIFTYSLLKGDMDKFEKALKKAMKVALETPVKSYLQLKRAPILTLSFENNKSEIMISKNDYVIDDSNQKFISILENFNAQISEDPLLKDKKIKIPKVSVKKYFKMKFIVENKGTMPANDVQAFLTFPEFVQVIDHIGFPVMIHTKYTFADNHEVRVYFEKVGHKRIKESQPVYITFPNGEPQDFIIKYEVFCDELPDSIVGELKVKFTSWINVINNLCVVFPGG